MICAFSSANNFFSAYVHCQNKFLSQSLSLIKTHQPFGTPFIENLPSYPGSRPHHPLSHLSDAPPHFLPSTILGAALRGRLLGLQMAETQPKPAQRKSGLYVLQQGCACFRNLSLAPHVLPWFWLFLSLDSPLGAPTCRGRPGSKMALAALEAQAPSDPSRKVNFLTAPKQKPRTTMAMNSRDEGVMWPQGGSRWRDTKTQYPAQTTRIAFSKTNSIPRRKQEDGRQTDAVKLSLTHCEANSPNHTLYDTPNSLTHHTYKITCPHSS